MDRTKLERTGIDNVRGWSRTREEDILKDPVQMIYDDTTLHDVELK